MVITNIYNDLRKYKEKISSVIENPENTNIWSFTSTSPNITMTYQTYSVCRGVKYAINLQLKIIHSNINNIYGNHTSIFSTNLNNLGSAQIDSQWRYGKDIHKFMPWYTIEKNNPISDGLNFGIDNNGNKEYSIKFHKNNNKSCYSNKEDIIYKIPYQHLVNNKITEINNKNIKYNNFSTFIKT